MGQSWLVWSIPGLMDRYELSTGDFQPDKFLPFELQRGEVVEVRVSADAELRRDAVILLGNRHLLRRLLGLISKAPTSERPMPNQCQSREGGLRQSHAPCLTWPPTFRGSRAYATKYRSRIIPRWVRLFGWTGMVESAGVTARSW